MLTDEQAEQLKTQCLQLIVASQELQEQLTAANQTISEQSTIIEQLAKDNLTLAARLEQLDHKTANGLRLAA